MATGGRDNSHSDNGALHMGTKVPNRIFVGGISGKTSEEDLRNLFSKFGNVKATKIIFDKCGASKGFGFVTFETEQEANHVLNKVVDRLVLKERKLNLGPAIMKHSYNRSLETGSIHSAPLVWSHPYASSASFPNREYLYYPQASWPPFWNQFLYAPHQFPYAVQQPHAGYPHYVYSVNPSEYPYQGAGQVPGSDLSDSSADSSESAKNIPRSSTPAPSTNDYDRNHSTSNHCHTPTTNASRYSTSSADSSSSCGHPSPVSQMHPVFAKTPNGVAVISYPAPFVMGSPTIVHIREGGTEQDNVLTELGFLHSPIASGALTPPPTPMASMSCDFNVNTSMESLRKN